MKKFVLTLFIAFGVLSLNAQLSVSINHTNIPCNGDCNGTATAVPTGGTPPYTYAWAPAGATSQVVSGLCAGNYTVTVTDATFASATATVAILQPTALGLSFSSTSISCYGGLASITAIAFGGTPPYAYLWTPGNYTTPTLNNVSAGSYTCTVTDANGCIQYGIFTLNQPPAINPGIIPPSSTCTGTNVSFVPNVTGGTGVYTYSWTFPGATPSSSAAASPNVVWNTPGTYTVTMNVTDANGCSATGTVSVTIGTSPVVTVTPGSSTICGGSNTTFTASGAMVYVWQPGNLTSSSITISPSSTSTYTCVGTAPNGCTDFEVVTVTVNPSPTLISTAVVEAGCSFNNGSATVNATGITPFTYTWSPSGGTNATEINLPAGIYTCTITDPNLCVISSTITVGDSCDYVWPGDANDDAVADNIDILDIGIANGATGTIRANASLTWIGQPSTPWGPTLLNGTDYKWVDCNGDGIINPTDTNAVIQNFGFTHNNRLGGVPVYDAALPDLTISMGQNILVANSAGSLTVGLGSASTPVSNLYGLAFTLNFDATQIDAASFRMNENGTWMGTPGVDLMGVVMNNGTGTGAVQVAITRLNQTDANGFGNIANVGFMTTGNLVGTGNTQNVNFTISNVTVISANEMTQNVNTINDSVLVADPIFLGVNENNTNSISAYPNPFDASVTVSLPQNLNGKICEVILTDASGRVVLTKQAQNSNSIQLQRGNLEAGIYFCTVRSDGQTIGTTKMIVK